MPDFFVNQAWSSRMTAVLSLSFLQLHLIQENKQSEHALPSPLPELDDYSQ